MAAVAALDEALALIEDHRPLHAAASFFLRISVVLVLTLWREIFVVGPVAGTNHLNVMPFFEQRILKIHIANDSHKTQKQYCASSYY
jgi:hypothetical protein